MSSGSSVSLGLLKCRGCPCVFFSQADLDIHGGAFGRRGHSLRFRKLHESFEDETALLHGGAERLVFELARLVRRSRGFSG